MLSDIMNIIPSADQHDLFITKEELKDLYFTEILICGRCSIKLYP